MSRKIIIQNPLSGDSNKEPVPAPDDIKVTLNKENEIVCITGVFLRNKK